MTVKVVLRGAPAAPDHLPHRALAPEKRNPLFDDLKYALAEGDGDPPNENRCPKGFDRTARQFAGNEHFVDIVHRGTQKKPADPAAQRSLEFQEPAHQHEREQLYPSRSTNQTYDKKAR